MCVLLTKEYYNTLWILHTIKMYLLTSSLIWPRTTYLSLRNLARACPIKFSSVGSLSWSIFFEIRHLKNLKIQNLKARQLKRKNPNLQTILHHLNVQAAWGICLSHLLEAVTWSREFHESSTSSSDSKKNWCSKLMLTSL